jgi:hypothetical protein
MRRHHTLITGLALSITTLGIAGIMAAPRTADASTVTARATETVDGRITKVDREAKTFVLLVKQTPNGQQTERLTIKWNDMTECLLDGEPSNAEEAIKPGLESSVTHEDMLAIRVESKSPKPE